MLQPNMREEVQKFIQQVAEMIKEGRMLPWGEDSDSEEELKDNAQGQVPMEEEQVPEVAEVAPKRTPRSGEWFEVVNDRGVAIRQEPNLKASVLGSRKKLQLLELFESDNVGGTLYRKVWVEEASVYGWVIVYKEGKAHAPYLVPHTPITNENFEEDDDEDEPEEQKCPEFLDDWSQLARSGGR